ncbi:AcrR family transcriptional regulator [Humibacillus xanthopallidus]|uniref:AcrR family transcriptional regulator n=1 Tax=Humibacillus xanthopallidus TaxID=412689 RepID=A0A543PVS4_9MICO|nr:TetR/AcrR family transcriptional regulator [Humibacillus xanthopallidus]TQN48188.1 AcrR family transcriptional regulator [Humibacillus xanthopallidus]
MARAQLTTSTVIARAAEQADASGFDSVSLAAVARSFGVRTPSLYEHVRDLAALRDGVTVLALDELATLISDAVAGRAQRDALLGLFSAHRTYAQTRPGCWESLQRRAGPEAVSAPAAQRMVRVIDAVLRGYGIRDGDRTHATRIVGAALNGFLNLERIGSFAHSEPAPDQSWTELLDSLHFLLVHWHDRSPLEQKEPS